MFHFFKRIFSDRVLYLLVTDVESGQPMLICPKEVPILTIQFIFEANLRWCCSIKRNPISLKILN